jgi:hypothetical protein
MKTNVGVWIDNQKAVVTGMSGVTAEIHPVFSAVEQRIRHPEDELGARREKNFLNRLNEYYDEVISYVRYADAIFIFGPGEAKSGLKTRIENEALGEKIAGVESDAEMTDFQIAMRVRTHFIEEVVESRAVTSFSTHADV